MKVTYEVKTRDGRTVQITGDGGNLDEIVEVLQNNRWQKVGEGTPPEGVTLVILVDGEYMTTGAVYNGKFTSGGTFGGEITHWMSPTLPMEVENG